MGCGASARPSPSDNDAIAADLEAKLAQIQKESGLKDPKEYETFVMIQAIKMGNASEVARLIDEKGFDPCGKDLDPRGHERHFLHAACMDGTKDVVKTLLDKKADPNAYDRYKSPVLHGSAIRSATIEGKASTEVPQLLIDAKADINYQWGSGAQAGSTILMCASTFPCMDELSVFKCLLSNRCDVDRKRDDGKTCLQIINEHKNRQLADDMLKDLWGDDEEKAYQEMTKLLKEAGATECDLQS